MATEVYDTEVIRLQDDDGTEVTLRPLVIKQLRKFQKEWDKIDAEVKKARDEGESVQDVDIFVRLSKVCLERQLRNNFDTDKQYLDFLEESLDVDTMKEIIFKCSGISFGEADPKLLEALAEMETDREDGAA